MPTEFAVRLGRGAPFDKASRAFFEPRFGRDFSDVRVHVGAKADMVARSIGARAFTIGRDIAFAAGEYNPASNEGRNLLAHELTHVIQQSGASGTVAQQSASQENVLPTLQVQRKATVSLEGYGTQIVGDDDSDVTFTPTGTFEASGDPLANVGMVTGAQSDAYQSTSMPDASGYEGTLRIKAGRKGVVRIAVKAHFFMDDMSNDEWDQDFACSWRIETDSSGRLKIHLPRQEINPSTDDHSRFQLSGNLNPLQDQEGGEVQITPVFQGYQDSKSSGKDIGVQIGPKDSPVSGGGSLNRGKSRTFPAASLAQTFSLRLVVTDIAPPKKREPRVAFGTITASVGREHNVMFERSGDFKVSREEEAKTRQFFMQLSPETRQGLHDRTLTMKLTGYASTKGWAQDNRKLARRRIDAVKPIVEDFGVPVVDFTAPGEYGYIEEDPKKEADPLEDRRVHIYVEEAPVKIADPEPEFAEAPFKL